MPARLAPRFALALVILSVASAPARANVTQPDGTVIPTSLGCAGGQPTGLGVVFARQCTSGGPNLGAACPGNVDPASCDNGQHGTCEATLWHAWNDDSCIPSHASGLSPRADAGTTPETFQPTCALTFTLLSRGTARFHDVFGWYNVTGHAPDPSDLHVMLDCNAQPNASVVLDLVGDPAYRGGEIGFFLATPESRAAHAQCDGGDCCASVARLAQAGYVYYSQRAFNPDAAGAGSYVHLLAYDSRLVAHKFYFAWEDLYAGGGNNDFTDLVTGVEGVECSGAGQHCDTGLQGACAQGLTVCRDGALGCTAITGVEPERCDGVDNDCDGLVDNDATCPADQVCLHGACTPRCDPNQEFACGNTKACDPLAHVCVDLACAGVTCPPGQLCAAGTCHSPCDGVTCPHGTTCVQGACLDPCADVTCAPGQVCTEGVCVAGCNTCEGLQCANGLVCGATGGACVDPSCATPCGAGTYCDHGQCVDACTGAVCPAGQHCAGGACVDDGTGSGSGSGGGGGGEASPSVGCACDTGAAPLGGWPLALAALWLGRRRRPVR